MARKTNKGIQPPPTITPPGWYRSVAAKSLTMNVILAIALTALIIDKITAKETPPKYFGLTNDGRTVELTPLGEEHENDTQVSQWVVDALGDTFDWNFNNYKQRTDENCKKYFTDSGCESYREGLVDQGILNVVKDKRLIVSAVAAATPIIAEKGLNETGVYEWTIQLPLLVTYESSSKRTPQGQILEIVIVRQSVSEKPRGMGIDKITYLKKIETS